MSDYSWQDNKTPAGGTPSDGSPDFPQTENTVPETQIPSADTQSETGGYQNNNSSPYNGYQNSSYMPTGSSTMATVALVLGICSILFTCCGGSCFFGAIGIILALLSRGSGHMNAQAKVGLGLSIGGIILGIIVTLLMIIFSIAPSGKLEQYMDTIERYSYIYESDDDYLPLDEYNTYGDQLRF